MTDLKPGEARFWRRVLTPEDQDLLHRAFTGQLADPGEREAFLRLWLEGDPPEGMPNALALPGEYLEWREGYRGPGAGATGGGE